VSREFEAALRLAPWNDSLRIRLFLHYRNTASKSFTRRDPVAAARLLQQALTVYSKSAHAQAEYAILLMHNGSLAAAVEHAGLAVEQEPRFVLGRRVLADALARSGRAPEAAAQWRALLAIEPGDPGASQAMARFESSQQ